MKTSASRILTTHVGSMPRPESIKAMLRARLTGQAVDEAQLSARVEEAVAEAVRQQARVGIDVVSDGEMGKTSFLAYADERLTGFVAMSTGDPGIPSSNAGISWARRIDCGFAQGALYQRQHPTVMWAKFDALVAGARLASERLWR